MCFAKNVKYVTIGDPEGSRSETKILDVENLANGAR